MLMKNKTIYVVTAEVGANKESDFFKETGSAGAFMNALVGAANALDAGEKVKKALEEDLFEDILIEEIVLSDNFPVEKSETGIDFKVLKKEAEKSSDVIYGEFFLFDE